jgi:hypothetical protein
LGWTEISARVVNIRSIVQGEIHENEIRKHFTPSERVAIERTINAEIERRQGARTDLGQNVGRSRVADESAKLAGFGNRETARPAVVLRARRRSVSSRRLSISHNVGA